MADPWVPPNQQLRAGLAQIPALEDGVLPDWEMVFVGLLRAESDLKQLRLNLFRKTNGRPGKRRF